MIEMINIPGVSGMMAGSDGHIYRTDGERVNEYSINTGYFFIRVGKKNVLVHHLIAKAFLGERPDGYDVDHINYNKEDNRPENLRYLTIKENRGHRRKGVSRGRSYIKVTDRDGKIRRFTNCNRAARAIGCDARSVRQAAEGAFMLKGCKVDRLYFSDLQLKLFF